MSTERRAGIAALHSAFLSGERRPSDHLAVCLDRIAQRNPEINAIVALCEDRARREADASDARFAAGQPLGPLDGITVGIKDTFDVLGLPTTFGSPLFKDNLPDRDCLSVERLSHAGAVIVGKTNTSEFAAGAHTTNDLFGPTRNPWNTDLSPGGSTGGGAAGVADGMFDLALGSDLGGSLRVPAAFCGVLGIRPTPGLVPKSPDTVPFDGMSIDGLIGRSASDLAFGLDVVARPHPSDPKSPPADWQPRFAESLSAGSAQIRSAAFLANFSSVPVSPDILRICKSAVMNVVPEAD
ncbi:MAG: amidase, partial [Pseudomonadota bacterium]